MGFVGRSKITNDTIAKIVQDYVTKDFDSFDDLVYRYGVEENELREIIESVFPTQAIIKPTILYFKSKL